MRLNARKTALGVFGGLALGAAVAAPAYAAASPSDLSTGGGGCMQMMTSNPEMARMCGQMMAGNPEMARMCAEGMNT